MSGKTALVVDDSKSARFALRKYLENHAYRVDTAESAEAAYQLLRDRSPDLIFLDHIMPGEDGFEALRHLKADPRTRAIPVVICSGNEGESFVADARSQGAAGVLAKPPTPEQLLQVLDGLNHPETREPPAVAAAPEATAPVSAEPEPQEASAAPVSSPEEDAAGTASSEARLSQLEQQLLSRITQLEQTVAALQSQLDGVQALAARDAADQLAAKLLKALGRDAA